jgi:hypothetical protein
MVSLWLPIIAAAIGVFIASSILHMVLPYHRSDVKKLPVDKEDALLDAFGRLGVAPDDYVVPHPGSQAGMRDAAFVAKATKGPRVFFSLGPGEAPSMGPYLALWFVYCLVVSAITAYIVWRLFGRMHGFGGLFRLGSAIAFVCYGMALPQMSIWYRRSWATTWKSLLDSAIYGAVTGAAFGWLWPQ